MNAFGVPSLYMYIKPLYFERTSSKLVLLLNSGELSSLEPTDPIPLCGITTSFRTVELEASREAIFLYIEEGHSLNLIPRERLRIDTVA